MLCFAEFFAELIQRQHVAVRVDAGSVQPVPIDQTVAHFIGGIGKQQNDLPAAHRHRAQQNGKAVAAEDRERDPDRTAARFDADVPGDLLQRCIVALCTRNNRLRHRNDVAVTGRDAGFAPRFLHGIGGKLSNIVALADNGCADAAHNSTDRSHHGSPLSHKSIA